MQTLLQRKVSRPAVQRLNMVTNAAAETQGPCPGGRAIAGNDKIKVGRWRAVCEVYSDKSVIATLLFHRSDLLAKDVADVLVVFGEIVEDLCEVAAEDLILRHKRLLVRISSSRHGRQWSAILVDHGHTIQRWPFRSHCGFHTRNLSHDGDADGAYVDILSTWAQLWEALLKRGSEPIYVSEKAYAPQSAYDNGDICSGFGKPVSGHWACHRRTDNEDLQIRHTGMLGEE